MCRAGLPPKRPSSARVRPAIDAVGHVRPLPPSAITPFHRITARLYPFHRVAWERRIRLPSLAGDAFMTDRSRHSQTLTVLGIAMACAVLSATLAVVGAGASPDRVEIVALSNDPAYVSGGDVLLKVRLPQALREEDVRVSAGSRDVTASFHADADRSLVGLVTGLAVGRNTVSVSTKARGTTEASLEITNYP